MNDYTHRLGIATLSVTGSSGPGTPVSVEQVAHSVGIGNIGFELMDVAADGAPASDLVEPFLALFNQVTLGFYWRIFEPQEGAPDTERLLKAAKWFKDRGVRTKGHPLAWHTLAPQWLLGRDLDEVEKTLRARITREASAFAGLVDHWDAINEAVIMPRFTAEDNAITPLAQKLGRVEIVRLAFDTAREANPNAKLVLNDFLLTEEYAQLIEDCLAAGVQIDALGLQTHMHQGFRGEDDLSEILERFGKFGLPLQFTETTLVSGHLMPEHIVDLNDYQVDDWPSTPEGEERQADEIRRHYSTVFAHPLVESVTYWGFCDREMWLGAPAGFLRKDGSPKPAYEALDSLVHGEWWLSPTEVVTGEDGTVNVSGWGGTYRATVDGTTTEFTIESGKATAVELA